MLVPTGGPPTRGDGGRGRPPRRRKPVAWWKLGVGYAAGLAVIDLMDALDGMGSLLVMAVALGALGVAGWFWGFDSRDGGDWKPRRVP
jgi:hypothetical protein